MGKEKRESSAREEQGEESTSRARDDFRVIENPKKGAELGGEKALSGKKKGSYLSSRGRRVETNHSVTKKGGYPRGKCSG